MVIALWIATLIIVPILTYVAIGFYVKMRMVMGKGFSLWHGMLEFHPMDMKGKLDAEDVVEMVREAVESEEENVQS